VSLAATTREIQRLVGAKQDGVYGPNTAARILTALGTQPLVPPVPGPDLSEEMDDRTLRNFRTLEPKAQEKFTPFIRQAKAVANSYGVEYVAISGTRGKKEQNDLYAKGRTKPGRVVTNARYGYSNHNFGIALDFGVFKGTRYLDSSDPELAAKVHKAVSLVAKQHGIDWGGSWNGFRDLPHFEVSAPLSMAEKRRRLFAGKPMLG